MEERTVRTAFIFPFPDTIPTAITRAWSGRVPGPLLRRAVSSSDRDRRCLLKPPWLNLGAPGRRRLAGSPSSYRYPPPRAMASASPGQASRTSLQSRWATRHSPPATPHFLHNSLATGHWRVPENVWPLSLVSYAAPLPGEGSLLFSGSPPWEQVRHGDLGDRLAIDDQIDKLVLLENRK